jgi:hypothetical protein
VKRTIFLDEAFEPYKAMLEGKMTEDQMEEGREEHWSKVIQDSMAGFGGKALIRAGSEHVEPPRSLRGGVLSKLKKSKGGALPSMLQKSGIEVRVIHRTADVNQVFGK